MSIQFDLERHFAERLRCCIHDTEQSCHIGEVDDSAMVTMVLAGLYYELVRTSAIVGMNEQEFIKSCRIAYRALINEARRSLLDG